MINKKLLQIKAVTIAKNCYSAFSHTNQSAHILVYTRII